MVVAVIRHLLTPQPSVGASVQVSVRAVGLENHSLSEADKFSIGLMKYILLNGVVELDTLRETYKINGEHFKQLKDFVEAVGGEAVFSRPDPAGAPKATVNRP